MLFHSSSTGLFTATLNNTDEKKGHTFLYDFCVELLDIGTHAQMMVMILRASVDNIMMLRKPREILSFNNKFSLCDVKEKIISHSYDISDSM